jgi:hypothetical protein
MPEAVSIPSLSAPPPSNAPHTPAVADPAKAAEAAKAAEKVYSLSDLEIDLTSGEGGDTPPVERKQRQEPKADDAPPEDQDEPPAELDDQDKAKPAAQAVEFDADDKPFLKQMSEKASQHFGRKIVALKQQQAEAAQQLQEMQSKLDAADGKKLPDAWHDHEQAYTLSPQYQEISGKFAQEQAATHFWDEQLEACLLNKNSETFTPYMMPGQDGKPVRVTEDQADPRHEKYLNDLRQQHYRNQEKLATEAQAIAGTFGKTYKEADTAVRGETAKHFKWLADKKHMLQKPFSDLLSKIPEPYRKHPLAEQNAALATQLIALKLAYDDLKRGKEAAAGVEDDQRRAGPIPGKHARNSHKAEEVVYKVDDLAGM